MSLHGFDDDADTNLRLRDGRAATEEEEEDDHCDNSLLALLILPNCLMTTIMIINLHKYQLSPSFQTAMTAMTIISSQLPPKLRSDNYYNSCMSFQNG